MGCSSSSSFEKEIIFLIGRPGSGQKTQSNLLNESSKRYGIIHIDSLIRQEMLRKSSVKLDQINEDKLVPSEDLVELLNNNISNMNKDHIILEGFPKCDPNINAWKKIIGKNFKIHSLIYLNMDENLLLEREKEKIDSMGEMWVKKKNKIFNEQTIPCILNLKNTLNFIEIDANKKEKDIHNEIVKKIKEIDSLKKFVTLD